MKSNLQLENKCKALEEKVTNLPSTIFEEVEDRHHRRKILVITGIPEQTDSERACDRHSEREKGARYCLCEADSERSIAE